MTPPTGNRRGEVHSRHFDELLAKFRPGLPDTVTFVIDPRLSPWIDACSRHDTHPGVFHSEILREQGGSSSPSPFPI